MIDSFKNKYYFLSNFYNAPIIYNGIRYENNEAAFHAQKNLNRSKEFCTLNPSQAKALGRKVLLREDWEMVKDLIMYEINYEKYIQNTDLKKRLLETGEQELVEGNFWNDTYWGVCNGVGENHLGKILMKIRGELRECN